jgi:hypothetical protein
MELNLYVDFSKDLTEKEQEDFWYEIIVFLESNNLRAGGGHDYSHLDWVIDCQDSTLKKDEIIEKIFDFFNDKDELLLNYKIG